jgi:hypothetical protein
MPRLRIKRGTRAQLNSAAAANSLAAGELYLITDENRFAAGLSVSSYESYHKNNETLNYNNTQGIVNLAPGTQAGHPVTVDQLASLTSSKALVTAIIPGGTTLTKAAHIGKTLKINGGTINLPADADWDVGDEVWFSVVGTNATTINGNGATINLGPVGLFSTAIIAGTAGQHAWFKKMGANEVFASFAYTYLGALFGVSIPNPKLDNVLRFDGTNWVNTPQNFSIYDFKNRGFIAPGSGTTLSTFGYVASTGGTLGNPQPTATSVYTRTNRFTFATTATAGTLGIIRSSVQRLWRGNAAGEGGFKVRIPFGNATLVTGQRTFVGLDSNSSAVAASTDPFTTNSTAKIGVAANTHTGNWFLINNAVGTTPTLLDLGANFALNTTSWYQLTLWCDPNTTGINYEVINLSTGTGTLTGTLTTNIPTNTTYMHFYAWITNNATASIASIALGKISMEWG